jgi:hypothetical protein
MTPLEFPPAATWTCIVSARLAARKRLLKAPPLQGECSRPRVGQFRGAQCVKAKVLQMGGSQHAVITIFQLNKSAACFAGG